MIVLEKATLEDQQAINALATEVHSLHVAWRPDIYEMPKEIYPADRFQTCLEQGGLYVARQETAVVGYALIKIRDYNWAGMVPRRVLFLDEICVSEALRRQGIGQAMMASLRDLAKAQGCTGMQLGVYPQNQAAMAFYEKCGFSLQHVTLCASV